MPQALFIIVIACSGLLLLVAYLQVRPWLYPAALEVDSQPADSRFQRVSFQAEDGLQIVGWYAPSDSGKIVLLLHGHSGNRDQLLEHAQYIVEAGYGALLIDFRNHGESDGRITSMGYHETKDARAAYRFLQARDNVEQIVIWGHSMGGAVASRLMSEVHAAGLFIEATFADFPSLVRFGAEQRGVPARPISDVLVYIYGLLSQSDFNEFRPIEYLVGIETPVLLFHGSDDPVIPLAEAQRIAAVNAQIRLDVFEGAGHSDLYELQPDRYRQTALNYLQEVFD